MGEPFVRPVRRPVSFDTRKKVELPYRWWDRGAFGALVDIPSPFFFWFSRYLWLFDARRVAQPLPTCPSISFPCFQSSLTPLHCQLAAWHWGWGEVRSCISFPGFGAFTAGILDRRRGLQRWIRVRIGCHRVLIPMFLGVHVVFWVRDAWVIAVGAQGRP